MRRWGQLKALPRYVSLFRSSADQVCGAVEDCRAKLTVGPEGVDEQKLRNATNLLWRSTGLLKKTFANLALGASEQSRIEEIADSNAVLSVWLRKDEWLQLGPATEGSTAAVDPIDEIRREVEAIAVSIGSLSRRKIVGTALLHPFRTARKLSVATRTASYGYQVADQRFEEGYRSVTGREPEGHLGWSATDLGTAIETDIAGDAWPLFVVDRDGAEDNARLEGQRRFVEAQTRSIVSLPAIALGLSIGVTWGWWLGVPVALVSAMQLIRSLQVPPFDRAMAWRLLLRGSHDSVASRQAHVTGRDYGNDAIQAEDTTDS